MRSVWSKGFIYVAMGLLPSAVLSAPPSGVRDINQHRAISGHLTPGDTPGFPVTINRPGSYRLTSNLDLPSTPGTIGVDITAESVTLDLNGFAIIGPRVCPNDTEFFCPPHVEDAGYVGIRGGNNVTVLNGTVRGTPGAAISLGAHARIERVNAIWNSLFGILVGPGSTLEDNLIAQNGQGVLAGDDCIATGNRIRNNPFWGLQMAGTNCGYRDNIISCSPSFTCVSGGVQLGPNLCNGVVCP